MQATTTTTTTKERKEKELTLGPVVASARDIGDNLEGGVSVSSSPFSVENTHLLGIKKLAERTSHCLRYNAILHVHKHCTSLYSNMGGEVLVLPSKIDKKIKCAERCFSSVTNLN